MSLMSIKWHSVQSRRYPVARWRHNGKLVLVLTDYAIYLARDKALSNLTIEAIIYNIVVLMNFCFRQSIIVQMLDDPMLRKFRDLELVRLREAVKHQGSDKVQKRTTNSRLIAIYNFLFWLRQGDINLKMLIGPKGCRVRSSITANTNYNGRRRPLKDTYPLLFPVTGSTSKHRPVKAATEEVKESMLGNFSSIENNFIAARNILIVNIADALGMRRASINSLTCSQFMIPLEQNEALTDLSIVPSVQKFGYQFAFTFPFTLVSQIIQYIEGPRKALVYDLNVSATITNDRLLLSSTTGKPMANRTITSLISACMRTVGMNTGSIHAFRHKYVNDEVEREILRRVKRGLDTSIESIAVAVALKVGHANPDSLTTYISDAFGRIEKIIPHDNPSKVRFLEQEIERLAKQLQLLKSLQSDV